MALQDPYQLKTLKFNNIVSFVPAVPGTLDENTSVHEDEQIEWRVLAGCDKVTESAETEDDALTYFDPTTKKRVELKGTRVKTDTIKMEVKDWSPYLIQLRDRQTSDVEPGKFAPIFETDEPSALVWTKIEDYDNRQTLLATRYLYGRLRVDGDVTKDGKYSKPTLVLEVVPSAYNGKIATEALVGPAKAVPAAVSTVKTTTK